MAGARSQWARTGGRPSGTRFPLGLAAAGGLLLLGSAGCASRGPSEPSGPASLVRTWDAPGREGFVRVSPDGSRAVYQSDRSGSWDLYLRDLQGSESEHRLTDWEGDEVRAAWSPGGDRIVFQADREGSWDLYVLGIGTGDLRRLTSAPGSESAPDWSSRDVIAYQSDRAGSWDLWRISPDGTGDRRLTVHDGNEWHPRWSRDGGRLAFYSTWELWTDLWLLEPETGSLRPVLVSEHEDYWPIWDPADGWLLFGSDRGRMEVDAMDAGVWAVPAEGGEPLRVTDGGAGVRHLDWAGPGTHLWVTRRTADSDLLLVAAEGGPIRPLVATAADESAADFEPEGRRVVYQSSAARTAVHLFAVDLATGATSQLTDGRLGHRDPAAQRGGGSVVFTAGGGDWQSYDLHRRDPRGELRRITTSGNALYPRWCGDGRVAYLHGPVSYADRLTVWVVDATGGPGREVASEPAEILSDCADGRVLYAAPSGEGLDLFERSLSGGAPTRLTDHPARDTDGSWSPGGRRIAFASDRSGSFEIWVMPAAGGPARQLTETDGDARRPRWSPDGTTLVFERRRVDLGVWRADGPVVEKILRRP